ncbi:MAG: hypothetical protein JGK08_29005, partial [Microcoleus sp. PH2017_04_SCI_O_A]|nr:hypothetical protein [Microcoleus sp. PH2017_04_SCI_O_A]
VNIKDFVDQINESDAIGLVIHPVILSLDSSWDLAGANTKYYWATQYRESIPFDTEWDALLDFLASLNWETPELWNADNTYACDESEPPF